MDLHQIGVYAEIASAVAVVVTILFLAVEIRNNRRATQSSSLDALAVGFNEINYNVIGDPELTQIWQTAFATPEKLDDQGKIRFSMLMQCYINHYTALKKYHDLGVLPDSEWTAYLDALAGIMTSPGGKWVSSQLTITPALRSEIERFGGPTQAFGWIIKPEPSLRVPNEVQQK
jgi:hypothetical protein